MAHQQALKRQAENSNSDNDMGQQSCSKQTEDEKSVEGMDQQSCSKQTEDEKSIEDMVQETLKRKIEDRNSDSDKLNDDGVTQEKKKGRYVYTLEWPELNSFHNDDTDSVYSIQSKSTAIIKSENDSSPPNSCVTNCYSVCPPNIENKLPISSSSNRNLWSLMVKTNSQVENIINDDEMSNPMKNNSEVLMTNVGTQKVRLFLPAYFQFCIQCKKRNENPYFQYCQTCFTYRIQFEVNTHKGKPTGVKRLLELYRKREYNLINASRGISNSEQPVSDLNSSSDNNLCNICLFMPKNALFNHGATSHRYCCYFCAKRLTKKTNKCPICNVRIKNILKLKAS